MKIKIITKTYHGFEDGGVNEEGIPAGSHEGDNK